MLEQYHALLVLNVLAPFDGMRLRLDVVRANVNGKRVHALTESQFADQAFEMKERGWIYERVNDFGDPEIGITQAGQNVRRKANQ